LQLIPLHRLNKGNTFRHWTMGFTALKRLDCFARGMDRHDRSTDPENLTLFQRAALTGAEGLCQTAVESKHMRTLVECPVIAAVSLDCVPFNQNANPGAPPLIKINFLKAGLEQSISITGKEIAAVRQVKRRHRPTQEWTSGSLL
jgi:hypothetical protein